VIKRPAMFPVQVCPTQDRRRLYGAYVKRDKGATGGLFPVIGEIYLN
jgi:hypothetical protein